MINVVPIITVGGYKSENKELENNYRRVRIEGVGELIIGVAE